MSQSGSVSQYYQTNPAPWLPGDEEKLTNEKNVVVRVQ